MNTKLPNRAALMSCIAAIVVSGSAGAETCSDWQSAKSKWERDMDTYGRQWGNYIADSSSATWDEKLNAVYYDGQWIFQQISAYKNQTSPWTGYAEQARKIYVEQYLRPNAFGTQGYRRFSHGLYNDFKTSGPTTLRDIELLRDSGPFAYISTFSGEYAGFLQSVSRETAYTLQTNINAERAGLSRISENGVPRVESLVGFTEEHFRQWKTGDINILDINKGVERFAPFMAALSMHALIEWIEWEEQNGRDPNRYWPKKVWPSIEAMMQDFLKWQYQSAKMSDGTPIWRVVDGKSGFVYETRGSDHSPAYDLNGLIGYPYMWTSERIKGSNAADAALFGEIADKLFIGGVSNSYIQGNGKIFNQIYRLTFKYMDLRNKSAFGLCSNIVRPKSPSNVVVQ